MEKARTRLWRAALGVFFACGLGACKARPGAACSNAGEATCLDSNAILFCQSGTFASIPCRGPNGCRIDRASKKVSCDDAIAELDDPCVVASGESLACSPDRRTALRCTDGKFAFHQACRGQKGCAFAAGSEAISCDMTLADRGDSCPRPGITACSADFKQVLVCRDGHFEMSRFCRGQNGCQIRGSDPICDETIAEVGDPCAKANLIACSQDAKQELVCQSGKFTLLRECPKTGCHLMNGRVDCK